MALLSLTVVIAGLYLSLVLKDTYSGANPLSEREQDVLRAAYGGADVSEIVMRPHISEGTVRNHLSAAIQKLYVRNRAQANYVPRQKGWI